MISGCTATLLTLGRTKTKPTKTTTGPRSSAGVRPFRTTSLLGWTGASPIHTTRPITILLPLSATTAARTSFTSLLRPAKRSPSALPAPPTQMATGFPIYWFYYREPGTYDGIISITLANKKQASLIAPNVTRTKKIHIILEVKDNGQPPLYSYRRIILTVSPK